MAVKSGQFVGMDGHTYKVALSGSEVTAEALTFAGESPVIISMVAGERKFVGYKSQTSKVKIVTSHPMMELYGNSTTSVALTVTDATEGETLFDGYVVPFAYSQPYSGCHDVIEIEAVDRITARKEIAYTNFGEPYGTDRSGLAIVQELCRRAGIRHIVEHINFSTVEFTGESPLNIPVAQAGFLQDEVGEVDVLAAICKFFGLTAHVFGGTLYLYDEHYLVHSEEARYTDANIYVYSGTSWYKDATYHEGKATSLSRIIAPDDIWDKSPLSQQAIGINDGILSGVTINVERAYDGVQVTTEGSDTSILLPDVCADENLEENDGVLGSDERVMATSDGQQYRVPKKSKLMELGLYRDGVLADSWDVNNDPVDGNDWLNGAMALSITQSKRRSVNFDGTEYNLWAKSSEGNYIWVRGALDILGSLGYVYAGRQKADKRYSHTGGIAKLSMKYKIVKNTDIADIDNPVTANEVFGIAFATIHSGNKTFDRDFSTPTINEWADGVDRSSILLSDGYTLLPTGLAQSMQASDVLVKIPNNGQVYVDFGWRFAAEYLTSTSGANIYIESLTLEGYGDAVNTECAWMKHTYNAREEYMLEAKTMLTTRSSDITSQGTPMGINARASVVPATNWVGGYMARRDSESIPISGILMEQLRERYGEPHTAYTMTVGKLLYPYKMTAYEGKKYTIESYDIDVYNTETTVTIN